MRTPNIAANISPATKNAAKTLLSILNILLSPLCSMIHARACVLADHQKRRSDWASVGQACSLSNEDQKDSTDIYSGLRCSRFPAPRVCAGVVASLFESRYQKSWEVAASCELMR